MSGNRLRLNLLLDNDVSDLIWRLLETLVTYQSTIMMDALKNSLIDNIVEFEPVDQRLSGLGVRLEDPLDVPKHQP